MDAGACNRIHCAGDLVATYDAILARDLLDSDVKPTDAWTREVVCEGTSMPTPVLRELVLQELALLEATPRGEQIVAVARGGIF